MNYIILIVYAVLSVGGLTCFKLGTQNALNIQISSLGLSLNICWLSLLGMAMYVASFFVYLSLVAKVELSYLTPMASALIYIMTMFVSFLIFHESFGLWKTVGIVLILCGVVLMNIKK